MKRNTNDKLADNLKPLKVSCNNADCESNLHCFRKSKNPEPDLFPNGTCNKCGISLIDWDRLYLKSTNDLIYTFNALKKEWIRHYFWHVKIPQRAINYALRKGRFKLRESIIKRINLSIAPSNPYHDGWQTPFNSNNPIHYAQHATATCCRHCLNYWHGIPINRNLLPEEINYLADLIAKYLDERISNLSDVEQKVPPIKNL